MLCIKWEKNALYCMTMNLESQIPIHTTYAKVALKNFTVFQLWPIDNTLTLTGFLTRVSVPVMKVACLFGVRGIFIASLYALKVECKLPRSSRILHLF